MADPLQVQVEKIPMANRPDDAKTPVEQMKRILLIGLGATVYSAEKIRELTTEIVNEMVAQGEMTQKEAVKFGEELTTRASHKVAQEHRRIEKLMKDVAETSTKRMLDAMGLVTRAEFDGLKREVERLSRGGGGAPDSRREAPRRGEAPRRSGTSARRSETSDRRTASTEGRSGERRFEDRRPSEEFGEKKSYGEKKTYGEKSTYGEKKRSYGDGPKRGFGAKPLGAKSERSASTSSSAEGRPKATGGKSAPGSKSAGSKPSGTGRSKTNPKGTSKGAPRKKK